MHLELFGVTPLCVCCVKMQGFARGRVQGNSEAKPARPVSMIASPGRSTITHSSTMKIEKVKDSLYVIRQPIDRRRVKL